MSTITKTGAGVVRHGLTSRAVLIDGEDPAEYQELREGFWAQYRPVGRLEEELVERAACCLWRLGRMNRLESEAIDELARQAHVKNAEDAQAMLDLEGFGYSKVKRTIFDRPTPASKDRNTAIDNRIAVLLEGIGRSYGRGVASERASATFMLLRRYEASVERSFYAAIARLEAIQGARAKGEAPAALGEAPAAPGEAHAAPAEGGRVKGEAEGEAPAAPGEAPAAPGRGLGVEGLAEGGAPAGPGEAPAALGEGGRVTGEAPAAAGEGGRATGEAEGKAPAADSAEKHRNPFIGMKVLPRLTAVQLTELPESVVRDLAEAGGWGPDAPLTEYLDQLRR